MDADSGCAELAIDVVEMILKDMKYNVRVVLPQFDDVSRRPVPEDQSVFPPRDPVVTIMGHVDHGKTTLLDALRSTSVAAHEAGGITQHIGAFSGALPRTVLPTMTATKHCVAVPISDRHVTFLDTPGHRAFSNMRQRGASVTDIVVLVVAADDGVKPQTVEAIEHARTANVPLLVAINKSDAPGANFKKVKEGLLRHNVQLEDFGGDVQAIEVSALRRKNLDVLVEAILLQADLMNLRGDPSGAAEGTIVESKMEKGRGPVATMLVQRGTLAPGACIVAGTTWGRVRALSDENGRAVKAAGPSRPVQVIGWRELPHAGDEVIQVASEQQARDVSEKRAIMKQLKTDGEGSAHVRARQLRERAEYLQARRQSLPQTRSGYADVAGAADTQQVPLLVRGDSHGTLEALVATLKTLKNDKLALRIISAQVGALTETDIKTAAGLQGTHVGSRGGESQRAAFLTALVAVTMAFNMEPSKDVKNAARVEKVSIISSRIIYDVRLVIALGRGPNVFFLVVRVDEEGDGRAPAQA